MGGYFVNYFNRFGRQWQVYVQAEGEYRAAAEQLGQFYVRNKNGDSVPLSALTSFEQRSGPEFTMRYNLYRCRADQCRQCARVQFQPGHEGLGGSLQRDHAG